VDAHALGVGALVGVGEPLALGVATVVDVELLTTTFSPEVPLGMPFI
jgi:hypothetical protein